MIALAQGLYLACSATTAWATTITMPKTDLALLGPIYLPIQNPTTVFEEAKRTAKTAIEQAMNTANSSFGPFDNETTSFTACLFSLTTGESLFDFFYGADGLDGSLSRVNLTEDTIFRTGSLGKLFTVYAWLVDIGDTVYSDPVTKYIPELAAAQYDNPLVFTNWTEITIGALASQMSGIGRDYHAGDYATQTFNAPPIAYWTTEGGYPNLTNEIVTQCDDYGDDLPHCTRQQKLQGIINHPPSFNSYNAPAYSNIAFDLLGFAYENITGKSLEVGQNAIFQKLGMTSTSYSAPDADADTIIPFNESYSLFNFSIGLDAPSGNQYTSTKDLRRLGQAIYTNEILSPVVTRRWLKPVSLTSQWRSAVGAPWEIFRTPILVNTAIGATRIVDTYTKSGDIGKYSTIFAMIPDYELGFSVLAAGAHAASSVQTVRSILVDVFYNAYEAASKQQAALSFNGTFSAPIDSQANSSITLVVDGGTGVNISKWTSNDVDFLATEVNAPYAEFRLYPTPLKYQNETSGMVYYKYHVMAYPLPGGEPDETDPWSTYNERWYAVDQNIYNNLATDAFVVGIDGDGVVLSVESQALRLTMYRTP